MLIFDFCLNAVLFNTWHVVFSVFFMGLYCLTNMAVSLISGDPIYLKMTWKDINTLYYVLIAIGLQIFSFYLFALLSILKRNQFKKMSYKKKV